MDGLFAFDRASARPRVRPADEGDVEGMARVSVDTWRLTYAGILPGRYLTRLRLPAQESQRRRLMAAPDTVHFVAEEPITGETVGFASAGLARGESSGITAEVFELYVQNGFQRQGLGRGLLLAARHWLAGQGHEAMIVWVLADNPARVFYERLGGRAAAQRAIRVGGALVEEAAYVWSDLKTP
jgi:GNAT superfamily N-acetyltransferase